MNLYPTILTIMIVLGLMYYVYLSVDWDWLNPYYVKKGFVLGSALRHEEWKESEKVQADRNAAEAEARAIRVDRDREVVNSRIQKLYESVNEPVPTPPVKTFFGGSKSTSKRERIEPLTDDFDGVIGTIEGGVSATPEEYLRKFSGRHAGAYIKRKAYKK